MAGTGLGGSGDKGGERDTGNRNQKAQWQDLGLVQWRGWNSCDGSCVLESQKV